MFDLFSPSHLLVIGIAVLILVGPKDLPHFFRVAGSWVRKMRSMADEFRHGLENLEREAELREIRDELSKLRGARDPVCASKATDAEAEPEPELAFPR